MSDSAIRRKAEEVVYKWKLKLDVTRMPINIHISLEDELVELIEEALEDVLV